MSDSGDYWDDIPDSVKDDAGDGSGYFDSGAVKSRAAAMAAEAKRKKLLDDIRHLQTLGGLKGMNRAQRLKLELNRTRSTGVVT